MEKHESSAQLKARARSQLLGKYGTLIPALLVVEGCMLLLSTLTTFSLDTRTLSGLTFQFVIEFLLQLFAGVFLAGQTFLYLNVACGGKISVSDVFYGFTHHPDRAILIQLLQLLLCLAYFIPFFICMGLWAAMDSPVVLMIPLSLAFCIGLTGTVVLSLQYSQSFYILLDFPEFTALQCLRFSREVMKGNKARLFYLNVSFLPMYLLGLCTCCIGFVFIIPYVNAASTCFYLELMLYRNRQGAGGT